MFHWTDGPNDQYEIFRFSSLLMPWLEESYQVLVFSNMEFHATRLAPRAKEIR